MDWYFYLNRWAIPASLSVVYLFFLYKRKAVTEWVVSGAKGEKYKRLFRELMDGLKSKVGDWRLTIVFAAALAIATDLLLSWALQQPLRSLGEPLGFSLLTGGILNPIAEELMFRGFLIGFGFFFIGFFGLRKYEKPLGAFLIAIVAIYFAAAHGQQNWFPFVVRLAGGALYGALYVASGRNLLPAIAAHSAGNVLAIVAGAAA